MSRAHRSKPLKKPSRRRQFALIDIEHLWHDDRDELPDWLVGANKK